MLFDDVKNAMPSELDFPDNKLIRAFSYLLLDTLYYHKNGAVIDVDHLTSIALILDSVIKNMYSDNGLLINLNSAFTKKQNDIETSLLSIRKNNKQAKLSYYEMNKALWNTDVYSMVKCTFDTFSSLGYEEATRASGVLNSISLACINALWIVDSMSYLKQNENVDTGYALGVNRIISKQVDSMFREALMSNPVYK